MATASQRASVAIVLAAAGAVAVPPAALGQDAPRRYALVIGLNEFRGLNARLDRLKWANEDANEVARVLTGMGYTVTPLVNSQARREDIVGELNRLARVVRRDDTFVLFFAGHGARNANVSQNTVYLLPYDARADAPDVEGIRLGHLMDYVDDIKAAQKLVLLDHCYSGQVQPRMGGSSSASLDATQPGARGGGDDTLEISRGAEPVPGWESIRQRAAGLVIIGASRGLAYESEVEKHGLFTAALLSALRSRAADTTPKDGKLTVLELLEYLPAQMATLANRYNLQQHTEAVVEGKNLASWELASALPPDSEAEKDAKRDNYLGILRDWEVKGYLKSRVKMALRRVIDKAFQANTSPLDPVEQKVFDKIKDYFEGMAGAEDERARNLEDFFNGICQANLRSEICRF